MQHVTVKFLGVFVLGALLAGGVSFAAPPPDASGLAQDLAPARGTFMRRSHHGWQGPMRSPTMAAIADLRSMQRLYLLQGRRKDVADLYRYVLSKTQNPALRNYAYHQLARSQLQVADADAAIATLRQNLDENLAHLNQPGHSQP